MMKIKQKIFLIFNPFSVLFDSTILVCSTAFQLIIFELDNLAVSSHEVNESSKEDIANITREKKFIKILRYRAWKFQLVLKIKVHNNRNNNHYNACVYVCVGL